VVFHKIFKIELKLTGFDVISQKPNLYPKFKMFGLGQYLTQVSQSRPCFFVVAKSVQYQSYNLDF